MSIFCVMLFLVSWTQRAHVCVWVRQRAEKKGGGIFKAPLEERVESMRGSINALRAGTQGVCVSYCSFFLFAFTVRVRLPDCYSGIQTRQAIKQQIGSHSCTGIHVHSGGRVTSAFTASLCCDGKERESYWDKRGTTAFKVGSLSVSAKKIKNICLYAQLSQSPFFSKHTSDGLDAAVAAVILRDLVQHKITCIPLMRSSD